MDKDGVFLKVLLIGDREDVPVYGGQVVAKAVQRPWGKILPHGMAGLQHDEEGALGDKPSPLAGLEKKSRGALCGGGPGYEHGCVEEESR
jgi:hypothetical protein